MILVVAATGAEARPLRRRLRDREGVRVARLGVGATRAGGWLRDAAAVISCGLAGGLDPTLRTGAVVVPDEVVDEQGRRHRCDPELVDRLRSAASAQGLAASRGTVVTRDRIVAGDERSALAGRGHAAVDMESGRLAEAAPRIAVVRVVLDTATHELSPAWSRPGRALLSPARWGEAVWLARTAPRLCDRAAAIVAGAC